MFSFMSRPLPDSLKRWYNQKQGWQAVEFASEHCSFHFNQVPWCQTAGSNIYKRISEEHLHAYLLSKCLKRHLHTGGLSLSPQSLHLQIQDVLQFLASYGIVGGHSHNKEWLTVASSPSHHLSVQHTIHRVIL